MFRRRRGDTGGLAWGVDGAVRVPPIVLEDRSARLFERDGGADEPKS